MKIFASLILTVMLLASACAQQATEKQPEDDMQMPIEENVPEAIVEETEEEPEAIDAGQDEASQEIKSNEVRMLGVGKYDPLEVRISKGGTVTFFNDGNIKTVITIKGAKTINTPVVEPGKRYEQEFTEAGTYEYWGVAYGPGDAKIIVE